jgi:hypothetical protein
VEQADEGQCLLFCDFGSTVSLSDGGAAMPLCVVAVILVTTPGEIVCTVVGFLVVKMSSKLPSLWTPVKRLRNKSMHVLCTRFTTPAIPNHRIAAQPTLRLQVQQSRIFRVTPVHFSLI